MTRLVRLGASSLTALLLILGPTACGGDDEGSDDPGSSSSDSTDSTDSSGSNDAPAGDDEPAEEGGEEGGDAPAGGAVFVDAVDDPAASIVFTEDAGFDPAESTVAVGDTVEFSSGDDKVHAVIVGDLSGYTITTGLNEYFRFDEPGTYPVSEELSGQTATITVE